MGAIALALGGCSVAAPPGYLARPADPDAPVPAITYRSVTAGAATMRPAEPQDWRALNRKVGPKP